MSSVNDKRQIYAVELRYKVFGGSVKSEVPYIQTPSNTIARHTGPNIRYNEALL